MEGGGSGAQDSTSQQARVEVCCNLLSDCESTSGGCFPLSLRLRKEPWFGSRSGDPDVRDDAAPQLLPLLLPLLRESEAFQVRPRWHFGMPAGSG